MDIAKKEYKDEFLHRFLKNPILEQEQAAFNNILGKCRWFLFASERITSVKSDNMLLAKGERPPPVRSGHIQEIVKSISKAKRQKSAICISWPKHHTVTLPLIRGENIYGYMVLSNLKHKPNDELLQLLSGYTNSITEEVAKEIELSRLYKIIRPRAIALSTVHTINRLLGSTLDINELFPRIARLALQILRSEKAYIYMMDKEAGGKLRCVAGVDYTKTRNIFRLRTRVRPLSQQVASTGRSIRKKNLLSVPLFKDDVIGVISVRDKIDKGSFTIFDQEILSTLAEQAVVAITNAQLYQEQKDLAIGSIKSLSSLLDLKVPQFYTHSNLFVELILILAREMGSSGMEIQNLHYAALLPDLGKAFLPEEMLKKPAPLSKREYRLVKGHTRKSVEIIKQLKVLSPTIPIILYHHERYDGKGYPDRLKAGAIPLGARIMAVADAFEAMICKRPYRKSIPLNKAIKEIRNQSGRQFDPLVVQALMRVYEDGRLKNLANSHRRELRKVFKF